jgi:hypothetical protein
MRVPEKKTLINPQIRGVSTRHLLLYPSWLCAIRTLGFDPEALVIQTLLAAK